VVGDPGEVRITVADNGPGIPDHLGETIFQPFVTNKPHGTGLGLGISLEIVQEHGGALTMVPSALGGACFEITLPIERRRRS
jgi:signal transduction histidine kinase